MLDREVAVTEELMQSILVAEGFRRGPTAGDSAGEALARAAKRMCAMREIVLVSLYEPSGLIVWSSDPGLIGRLQADTPELVQAMKGGTTAAARRPNDDQPARHAAFTAGADGYVVKAYVPAWNGPQVVGVVELHKVSPALGQALGPGRLALGASAALAGLMLLAAFYGLLRLVPYRAQRQLAQLVRVERPAAVGAAARSIAHSLRTPLAVIRSSAELLQLDQPDVRPVASQIIREVDRMAMRVSELLQLTCDDGWQQRHATNG
jgi:hypothetical protein